MLLGFDTYGGVDPKESVQENSLRGYIERSLPGYSPILVSNRGPQDISERGTARRGSGGVVTALLAIAETIRADWVAVARTAAESVYAAKAQKGVPVPLAPEAGRLYYATPSAQQYERYYSTIANPVLWFLQHYLWGLGNEPIIDEGIHTAWTEGYVEVNRQVAQRVAQVAADVKGTPLILVQDYQLYLVPELLRATLKPAVIQHFVHIPWPAAQYWKVLPSYIRDAVLKGLLGSDIIGFQSSRDVRNFLITCEENLSLQIDERERAVIYDGRVVYVRHYPISIDTRDTLNVAASPGVRNLEKTMHSWRPPKLIVRIDRTDPSKNIVRGFLAYEKLLRSHTDLQGQVQFWAFLQPSRQDIPVYQQYLAEIKRTASRINDELGTPDWSPIRLQFGESRRQAMAALKNFDVLLVNPVYDGLNLVAKEGVLVNQADGILVLSENAGAHEELHEHVLSINPFDVEATASALFEALAMPADRRHQMHDAAAQVVHSNDIARWIGNQVQDLRDLLPMSLFGRPTQPSFSAPAQPRPDHQPQRRNAQKDLR